MDPFLAVELLAHDRGLVLQYLSALCESHPQSFNLADYTPLHDLQIELLAEKQPNRLGSFLMWSNFYSLDDALTVCESLRQRNAAAFVRASKSVPLKKTDATSSVINGSEYNKNNSNAGSGGGLRDIGATNATSMSMQRALVVILGRMGGDANMKKALKLILADASAVPEALSFIQQQQHQHQQLRGDDDVDDLWTSLVSEFVNDPQTITGVLQHVGKYHLDPRALIKALPPKLHLPNLRTHLVSLFNNTAARRNAMGDCVAVLRNDVLLLLRTLHRLQRRATKMESATKCGLCARVLRSPAVHLMADRDLLPLDGSYREHLNDVVVFASGECYHTMCLTEAATIVLHRKKDKEKAAEEEEEEERNSRDVRMPTSQLTTLKHHCFIYSGVVAQRERKKEKLLKLKLTKQRDSLAGQPQPPRSLHEIAAAAMAQEATKTGGLGPSPSQISRGGGGGHKTVSGTGERAANAGGRASQNVRHGPEWSG
jgi:hypothetical protein